MTSATLARYREVLINEALDLRETIQHASVALPAERYADLMDETVERDARLTAARGITRATRMLRLVEAALDRIQHGDYGDCAECGCAIGEKRLNAVPWATHCIRHAEMVEAREREEMLA